MVECRQKSGRRAGFSLVELLIVIVIIGVLVSLIGAGVSVALRKARTSSNRAEISQLETALEQFKLKFRQYPPSMLLLAENQKNYIGSNGNPLPLAEESINFLTQVMFPRLDQTLWQTVGIKWAGDNHVGTNEVYYLEGDQCLTFFLGGIPDISYLSTPPANQVPNCLGFSTNPIDPAATTSDRIGPFYEFKSSRLVVVPPLPSLPYKRSPYHYSYLDVFGGSNGRGVPTSDGNGELGNPSYGVYAYFSTQGVRNNYARNPALFPMGFPLTDCATLGVFPYAESALTGIKYLKPNSFQIVSPGPNGLFGTGSNTPARLWNTVDAPTNWPDTSVGNDDQANFASGNIGSGQ